MSIPFMRSTTRKSFASFQPAPPTPHERKAYEEAHQGTEARHSRPGRKKRPRHHAPRFRRHRLAQIRWPRPIKPKRIGSSATPGSISRSARPLASTKHSRAVADPNAARPSCFLAGFAFVSSLTEVPIYWQSSVEPYSIAPSPKFRADSLTCRADSKSSYSICRLFQRNLEEAKRVHQLACELLPVLPRHARPRSLPVARFCGRKGIFCRNLDK